MQALLSSSELWAALIGAIVGGGFTLIGSLLTHRREAAAAARERSEQLRRDAYLEFLQFVHHINGDGQTIDGLDPRVAGAMVTAYGSQALRWPVTAGLYLLDLLRDPPPASANARQLRWSQRGIRALRDLWDAVAGCMLDELSPEPAAEATKQHVKMKRELLENCHRAVQEELKALRQDWFDQAVDTERAHET
jgi:hypothetical protein